MSVRPRPVKVVHMIPEDGLGGAETAARDMAERVDLSCDFHLILLAGKSLAPNRSNVAVLGARSPLNPVTQIRAARRILRLAPDVLICSLWKSVPAAILTKLLRPKTKLVAFFHSAERVHGPDRVMHQLLLRLVDEVWADSEATLAEARRIRPGIPTRTISYVIDRLEPTAGERPLAPRFLSWSRIHRHKGMDRSIDLIRRLVDRGIDAQFDLYGPDQGPRAALEDQAAALGIADRVHFHGSLSRTDLPALAADHSFLLQLSRLEGMAMVVVEAMQLGLVPIVTPVGEIGSYCSDGTNAVIVNPGDLDDAADRIVRLLRNGADYRRMSRAAVDQWAACRLYANDICAAANHLAAA